MDPTEVTTIHPALIIVFNLLIGSIFVLSFYVISQNIKRTRAEGANLIPLHVWTVALSYLMMMSSFMFSQTEIPWVFGFRALALVLGIYALGVLVKYQHLKKRR